MHRIEDFHTPLNTHLVPGTIYLVYGSDQQVKLELKKRGIPYQVLYEPTYEQMESEFKNGPSVELFDSQTVDALLIFPKQFKAINDRKVKPEDRHVVPNYQQMIVSDRRICFVIGDPHNYHPKDLKAFYKKLEGGKFVSLVMPDGYGIGGTPEEWNRFPITYARDGDCPAELSDQTLGESLIAELGTWKGVRQWRGVPRRHFYRLFLERGAGCANIISLLAYSRDYRCRDLIPWISPFLNRLNNESGWIRPGDLLGPFALWVYRASTRWAQPYQDGLKRLSFSGRKQLIFAPSTEAVDQYCRYLPD